ncbi:hypothetical protein Tsubulata_041177 [Turnera subulata]|uniref:PTB domain-containing protein n=1 Tax=Turnera subulata TaxID=218843 RepID=A0A9Q0F7Q6_9ROSI|nr:hypothetical protein Tsubulata_041177 [Turnera subulata]
MSSLLARPTVTIRGSKDEVYVAAVPLRAAKGPAQLVMSAAYSLGFWDFQHFMVLIRPYTSSSSQSRPQAVVFDFQPKDPEDIFTAIAVLSGRAVPGTVLVRKLGKLPKNKCWFVGSSKVDAVDVATKYSSNWDMNLRVGRHDCRDYTNGLVELLVGEKHVLERLRSSTGSKG